MKRFGALAVSYIVAAIILSNIMCAHVAFQYSKMLWGIKYAGYSAPASTAFLLAISYALGIIICLILARVFWKKSV